MDRCPPRSPRQWSRHWASDGACTPQKSRHGRGRRRGREDIQTPGTPASRDDRDRATEPARSRRRWSGRWSRKGVLAGDGELTQAACSIGSAAEGVVVWRVRAVRHAALGRHTAAERVGLGRMRVGRTIKAMSVGHAGVTTGGQPGPDECWCCGCRHDSADMVHLGNHPEVAVCIRCAYSLKTWAWEIDDRSRTGVAVNVRNALRALRRRVMHRGVHQNKWVGRPLRWLGRRLP